MFGFLSFPPLILNRFSSSPKEVYSSNVEFTLYTYTRASLNQPNRSVYKRGKRKSSFQVFVDKYFIQGSTIQLPDTEYRHLKARRVRNGDELLLFNSVGNSATALLNGNTAFIKEVLVKEDSNNATVPYKLTAVIGIPKSPARADQCVEKLTEIGITRIIWITSEHSVGELPKISKLDRLKRIAISAAKQSLQKTIPRIDVALFDEILPLVKGHPCSLLLSPDGIPILNANVINLIDKTQEVLFIIGPEGGFSTNEEITLISEGAIRTSLGFTRLRVETAAITAAAVICQIFARNAAD